mmetsp:Transcript_22559/g.45099  ORF Transcript_22559/g.45099 Transcript_22559/m.45099 type:complete len:974 (-) Transcript_22559:259-3180(-)
MGGDKLVDETNNEETEKRTKVQTEAEDEFEPESIQFSPVKTGNFSSFGQYDFMKKVSSGHGIMIMLHDDSSFDSSKITPGYQGSIHSRRSSKKPETGKTKKQNSDQDSVILGPTSDNSGCTCLKLKVQKDATLPRFHPNICVPSPILEDPAKLIKYGGGGSGVTVFGGYHPDLGSLVMKHGGHKDLIELVSLAKIERELGVRAKWKMDKLERDRFAQECELKNENTKDHYQEKCNESYEPKIWSARSTGLATQMIHVKNVQSVTEERNENENTEFPGEVDRPSAKLGSPRLSRLGVNPLTQLKKITANPLLVTISSVKNIVRAGMVKRNNSTGTDAGNGTGNSRDLNKSDTRAQTESSESNQLQLIIDIQNAMKDMKRRIPSFRMIYISPMHLRERADELKNSTFHSSILSVGLGQESGVISTPPWLEDSFFKECVDRKQQESIRETNKAHLSITSNGSIDSSHSRVEQRKGRIIYLFGAQHVKSSSLTVHRKNVHLCFGGKVKLLNDTGGVSNDELASNSNNPCSMCHSVSDVNGFDGYASLLAFVHQLHGLQRIHNWKITLAQQTIGQSVSPAGSHDDEGNDSRIKPCTTASSLLVRGKLEGQLLHHLIDEEIRVIKNLQLLTMPEELDVLEEVRREFDDLKSRLSSDDRDGNNNVTAADVSPLANMFVGKAIHKNFHPINGRFVMLWDFGKDLASKKIHLKPKEVVPAKHLENLFCKRFGYRNSDGERIPKNSLESTFVLNDEEHSKFSNNDDPHPIFDTGLDQWKSLLELALSMDHPSATNRIWTCGLNDGGLHNLFLNEENLWMFDLGEPSLEPVPAFLTKFLMSFFHALGMEEDEKGDWVVRFEQDENGKLRLTEKTKELLPKVISSFNITVDRLINELFDGYEKVRVLLVRYVVTQLISDSAFCIEKWRTKGGGDELRSEHQYYLEKWLWRALWDIFVSEELRRRYLTRLMLKKQLESRHLDSYLG